MQNAFVAPGAPIEVPAARAIVAPINELAAELRRRGVTIVWVAHENRADGRDWAGFFDAFVAPGRRAEAAAALAAGSELQQLWPELDVQIGDLRVAKNRYSALLKNELEKVLRDRANDTMLISGTKTNVCVECTGPGQCPASEPVCSTGPNTCGPCTSDAQCPSGLPACLPNGTCGICDAQNSTACDDPTPICDTSSNTCVGCVNDGECGGNCCQPDGQCCVVGGGRPCACI